MFLHRGGGSRDRRSFDLLVKNLMAPMKGGCLVSLRFVFGVSLVLFIVVIIFYLKILEKFQGTFFCVHNPSFGKIRKKCVKQTPPSEGPMD